MIVSAGVRHENQADFIIAHHHWLVGLSSIEIKCLANALWTTLSRVSVLFSKPLVLDAQLPLPHKLCLWLAICTKIRRGKSGH